MYRLLRRSNEVQTLVGVCRRCFATSAADIGEIGVISGAPDHTFKRKVGIFAPSRTPSQQGLSKTIEGPGKGPAWKIEFETMAKWENPLMGWTSTADALDQVARSALQFGTKEDAIAFCKKHGWEYAVREPQMRRTSRSRRYAGYGDNFSVKRNGFPTGGLRSELDVNNK